MKPGDKIGNATVLSVTESKLPGNGRCIEIQAGPFTFPDPCKTPSGKTLDATEKKRAKYNNRAEGRYRSKREAAYATHLQELKLAGVIAEWYYEPCSLVVQEDETTGKCLRWKPDFLVICNDNTICFHEVKGFTQRYFFKDIIDARTRYPFWKFVAVRKDKAGNWEQFY